jgi:hypothetical protein
MSGYKFDDDRYPKGTLWVWRLTVETSGAANSGVPLTNGRYADSMSPGISSEGTLLLVAESLEEAEQILGNRLMNIERLGPVFDPAAFATPMAELEAV